MNKSGANQKGFTLIEVLIAMTLFTIMMTLAFNALNTVDEGLLDRLLMRLV